ncbi:hypothetical protein BDV12DRAFT_56901 [Aspergillus spectabilis]
MLPAKRGQVRNGNPSPTRLEPVTFLNRDVIHLILSYLTVQDIFRLELVNREWRKLTREWMRRFGTRYIIQRTWHPGGLPEPLKPLPYEEFRKHGKYSAHKHGQRMLMNT